MHSIDALDRQIVDLIRDDARKSSEELARQLNVSSSTVRRRLKRLVDSGAVQIVGFPDPQKLGYAFFCAIAFNIDHEFLEDVVRALSMKPEIRWLAVTTGRFDALAISQFPSTEAFYEFVRKDLIAIPGIRATESFVCLNIEKRAHLGHNTNPHPAEERPLLR